MSKVKPARSTAMSAGRPAPIPSSMDATTERDEIAALAYEIWKQRGCPDGTAEEDWLEAEAVLRNRKTHAAAV